MDRKTKERKESCKCDTISLKRINVSCHKRTIISESESESLSTVIEPAAGCLSYPCENIITVQATLCVK